jgi:hypothetical protein
MYISPRLPTLKLGDYQPRFLPEHSKADHESANQCVLIAIGLFAVFLYCGLIYAGLSDFVLRLSKGRARNDSETERRYADYDTRNASGP